MATVRNLYIDAGADFNSIVTIFGANGLPLDLTGYTVKSQMRKSYTSSVYHTFTVTILNPPTDGKIQLSLTAAQSNLIPAGRWLYDIEATYTLTNHRVRLVEGLIVVTPQITQI